MPRNTKTTEPTHVDKKTLVVDASTTSKDDSMKQIRQQLASVIDCTISTARVRTQVTDYGVNAEVRACVAEVENCDDFTKLSDQTMAYVCTAYADTAKHDDSVNEVYNVFTGSDTSARSKLDVENTKKILCNLVARSCARAGDDSICALAATCNYIVEQLSKHGVETLADESKKTLKTHHIANESITDLKIWPFLRTLPCVQVERDAHVARLVEIKRKASEKKDKDKAKKAAAKIAAGDEKVDEKTKKVDKKVDEKMDASDDDDDDSDDKKSKKPREKDPSNSFCHHVYNIARTIVKDTVGGDVSSAVRVFGSNVVYELIKRYSRLIRIQIEFAGVKTIKANTITTINKIIMTDAGVVDDDLERYVSSRVNKYYMHVKATTKPVVKSELETKQTVTVKASNTK
jgi:hypothetical protein